MMSLLVRVSWCIHAKGLINIKGDADEAQKSPLNIMGLSFQPSHLPTPHTDGLFVLFFHVPSFFFVDFLPDIIFAI